MRAFGLELPESTQRHSRVSARLEPRIRDFEAWNEERAVSIKLVGGLQERAPSLHAIVRRKSPLGNTKAVRFLGFIGEYLAMFSSPHGPIPGADADAEIIGEEIGEGSFDLHPTATAPALIAEERQILQQVIVTALEVCPRQVSKIGADAPTVEEHRLSAESDAQRIPIGVFAADDDLTADCLTA